MISDSRLKQTSGKILLVLSLQGLQPAKEKKEPRYVRGSCREEHGHLLPVQEEIQDEPGSA